MFIFNQTLQLIKKKAFIEVFTHANQTCQQSLIMFIQFISSANYELLLDAATFVHKDMFNLVHDIICHAQDT